MLSITSRSVFLLSPWRFVAHSLPYLLLYHPAEAVDPVFQTNMLEMLKHTNRPQMVVGWYHSHPGLGCWLSGVDVNTQQSFEQLHKRSVAVVVDPIQSVKGKVVMDAFRTINEQMLMMGIAPRQTTSNLGHLKKPSIQALMHNLNRQYYSLNIDSRKNELEQAMLLSLHKQTWTAGLKMKTWKEHEDNNVKVLENMVSLAKDYQKRLDEEDNKTPLEIILATVCCINYIVADVTDVVAVLFYSSYIRQTHPPPFPCPRLHPLALHRPVRWIRRSTLRPTSTISLPTTSHKH